MGTAIVATAQVPDPSALIGKLKNLQIGELSYYLLQRPDAITDWKKGHPDAAEIEKIYARPVVWEKRRNSLAKDCERLFVALAI